MNIKTLFIYTAMYIYGFGLIFWANFYDKHATVTTKRAARLGFIGLILTLVYVLYVLFTVGLT